MIEQTIIDILRPVLEQWPTVAVLLVVGWFVWRAYQDCLDQLAEDLKWHRQQNEQRLLDRTKK